MRRLKGVGVRLAHSSFLFFAFPPAHLTSCAMLCCVHRRRAAATERAQAAESIIRAHKLDPEKAKTEEDVVQILQNELRCVSCTRERESRMGVGGRVDSQQKRVKCESMHTRAHTRTHTHARARTRTHALPDRREWKEETDKLKATLARRVDERLDFRREAESWRVRPREGGKEKRMERNE